MLVLLSFQCLNKITLPFSLYCIKTKKIVSAASSSLAGEQERVRTFARPYEFVRVISRLAYYSQLCLQSLQGFLFISRNIVIMYFIKNFIFFSAPLAHLTNQASPCRWARTSGALYPKCILPIFRFLRRSRSDSMKAIHSNVG